jgi:hypothetical protein
VLAVHLVPTPPQPVFGVRACAAAALQRLPCVV